MGTADYVAPEQVADSRNADGRADIYSLGLTFYFLLTGRRPFPKATLVDVLLAHRTEQPEPINELRPDVPFDLIDIIDRMIAKAPLQRFQTAREVADAIRSWLSESPSGREYSRISALMAAAMRAKQSPPATPGRPPSPPNWNWPRWTTSPAARPATRPPGGAAQPARPAAAGSHRNGRKRQAALRQAACPGRQQAGLPKLPADVFSDLLPGELSSAGSAGNPLAMLPAAETARPLSAICRRNGPMPSRSVLSRPGSGRVWCCWSSPCSWSGWSCAAARRTERPAGGRGVGTGRERTPCLPRLRPRRSISLRPRRPPRGRSRRPSRQPTPSSCWQALRRSRSDHDPRYRPQQPLELGRRNQVIAAAKQLGLKLGGKDLPMLEITVRLSNDPDLYIVVLSAELKVRNPDGKTVPCGSRTGRSSPCRERACRRSCRKP